MKSIQNIQPNINGFQFGWSSIVVNIGSLVPVLGVTQISYKETTNFENLYGAGNGVVGRGVGNYTYEASITLYKEELRALQSAARVQNPLNIANSIQGILPFDMIISYQKLDNSSVTVDILKNVQFMENGVDSSQGDTSITVTIPLIISHIQFGI